MVSQLFTTGVVRRLRRLERATEALERGETPVAVPSGRDEIGRLSAQAPRHHRAVARASRGAGPGPERAREHPHRQPRGVAALRRRPPGTSRTRAPTSTGSSGSRPSRPPPSPASVIDRFHPTRRTSCATRWSAGAGGNGERLEMLLRFRRDPSSEDWREAEAVYTVESGPGGDAPRSRRLPRRRVGAPRRAARRRRTPVPPRVHLPRVTRHHRRARHLRTGGARQLAAGGRDRNHRHAPATRHRRRRSPPGVSWLRRGPRRPRPS